MTARVITDPSALGWVLDPDTGRWEWSGSSDGGGSGGGAWDVIERVDLAGADQYDLDDFPDTHSDFMFRYQLAFDTGWGGSTPYLYVKVDGDTNVMSGSNNYTQTQYFPASPTGASQSRNYIPLFWATNQNYKFAAGDIYFYDANEKFQQSKNHHVYGSSVHEGKIQNFAAYINTSDPMSTESRRLTGFRVGNLQKIQSGYICLMGLKRD